ncbi:MAG: alpha-D-ribose 1-methylphosphonate 5-triphosphate diphosphatase [Hyphomicrobiaceae bacterium]
MNISIRNGRVLSESAPMMTDIDVAEGRIAGTDERCGTGRRLVLDAAGLLVLPGIVDLHGDAFERSLMPRPGVMIDYAVALREADRTLAAFGVTTAFLSLTATWEPGLRSLEAGRRMVAALTAERARLAVDHRLHVRWETYALDAMDDVIGWLDLDPAPVLSFNDHTGQTLDNRTDPKKLAKWGERAGLSPSEYLALVERVAARGHEVGPAIARLAAEGRRRGIVMMSHDDRTLEGRAFYRELGATVAEFPMTRPVIEDAARRGEPTVLGAPNVLRGGSHNGMLGAAEMIEAGVCDVLASDYFYPAQLLAAFKLAREHGHALGRIWPLVSANAARAARLDDRGDIAPGRRADIILVDDSGAVPEVVATIAAGRLVHLTRGEIVRSDM